MRSDDIRDAYDQYAHRYDSASATLERLVTREMRREFGSVLHGEVLEVAIGTGLNLTEYSDKVTSVTGIDLSANMLERARQRPVSFPVELHQMDAERLSFADHSFDCVAVSEALCTIPHPDRALAEMYRVCRPGGAGVFLEHVISSHWPILQVQRLVSPFSERRIGCHWTRDTVGAIRNAGFRIERDRSRMLGIYHLIVTTRPE